MRSNLTNLTIEKCVQIWPVGQYARLLGQTPSVLVVDLGLGEAEDLFLTKRDRGGGIVQWQESKESEGVFQVTREEEEALDQLCHQVRALAESIGHECEPQGDEGCLACLFKSFQRLCAAAFHQNELRITDVADVVALLGVLAPFKATERMKSVFQEKTLVDLRRSDEEWHDVGLDESLATSAVRACQVRKKCIGRRSPNGPTNPDHLRRRDNIPSLRENPWRHGVGRGWGVRGAHAPKQCRLVTGLAAGVVLEAVKWLEHNREWAKQSWKAADLQNIKK
ncbi:hypothetical protein EDD21DRAFT_355276 [Dissophora ornata]|nr:hypothetical protein EDD21DRAFT_355276 [Dissophora ornata]